MDILSPQRNTVIGLGYALQALAGTSTMVDGLVITPTSPASLTVNVGPGSLTSLTVIDATAYGSLASNLNPLVKQGVNTTTTAFNLVAPPSSGQSTNYLIQAQLLESDQVPVVLPYYNAADPTHPFSGPGNAGTSQNTQRNTRVQLQLKAGAPATAGSQATPAVDGGWVGLYVVTVSFGQSQITSTNLLNSQITSAPFIDPLRKGRGVQPGRLLNIQTFATHGTFTYIPTAGTNTAIIEVQGAGGGGAGTPASTTGTGIAGGGGASGSYGKSILPISTIGASQAITVGTGGVAGFGGGNGFAGGSSSFGSLLSAPGGNGGIGGGANTFSSISGGGSPGANAVGYNILGTKGSSGGSGFSISPAANQFILSGAGANSPGGGSGGGAVGAGPNAGVAGQFGGGGSGSCTNTAGSSPSFNGGTGGDGFVICWEYS